MATVMASGEEAQGQIISGFSPWDWNTFRKASHEETDPETEIWIISLHWTTAISFPLLAYSHGLAPSATISMRREDRLVSFWSLWAIIAQCRSLHFTKATRAVCTHIYMNKLHSILIMKHDLLSQLMCRDVVDDYPYEHELFAPRTEDKLSWQRMAH